LRERKLLDAMPHFAPRVSSPVRTFAPGQIEATATSKAYRKFDFYRVGLP
jgi:hypothetical protein